MNKPIPRYLADRDGYFRDIYRARKKAVIDYLGGKCARCGSTESLEVDHIDKTQKTREVSRHLSMKHNRDEFDKCQLLCVTCHRAKTGSENRGLRAHGTYAGWFKHKCPCDLCQAHRREYNARRRKPGGYGPRPRKQP